MKNDLKFLASILDVSNWPEDATGARLDVDGEVCFRGATRHDFYSDDLDLAKKAFVPACFYTRVGEEYSLQDIQDARNELSGKPGWEVAPEWANWLAQDKSGEWWFYEEKPIPQSFSFGNNFMKERVAFGKILGDWRNTLEKRPERCLTNEESSALNLALEVSSTLVAKGRMVNEWRGPEDGLPPVGVRCEIRQDNGSLRAGVIGYHTKNGLAAIIEFDNGGWDSGYDEQFSPLRTEEDKAVEKMLEVARNANKAFPTSEDIMRRLYRAGLRFTDQEPEQC